MKSLSVSLFIFLIGTPAFSNVLNGVWANKKGVAYLKGELPEQALKRFNEALRFDPFNGAYKLNLGVTHEVLEEVEKAKKYYELVAKDENAPPQARFAAHLNLGRYYSSQGKIEESLFNYQQALVFNEESIEVKTNIELLWQQQQQQKNQDQKKKSQGGKGQDQQKQDSKDGDQEQQEQAQQTEQQKKEQKKQPKEFKSKELTKADVRKILNELKKQEQQIREKEFGQKVKELPLDKDW